MKAQKISAMYVWENIIELSKYSVSAAGRIVILNTGGTSAGEGGMGSGSKSSEEKGTISGPDQKSNSAGNINSDKKDENSFDPVKEDIEKAEEQNKPLK